MSDPARFELYAFWRTSATYRVRVAVRLKGITPQEHPSTLTAASSVARPSPSLSNSRPIRTNWT